MPELEEITYSRDEAISVVRDYYRFLCQMYLDDSDIVEPPAGGWPNITMDKLQDLDKTEEVILLLRHLPYTRPESLDTEAAPFCKFANWNLNAIYLSSGRATAEHLKLASEGDDFYQESPSHVIGLTSGGRDNPVFVLDTELGIIHWPQCPGEIRHNPSKEDVEDDPYDYAPENEAEWRADAPAWAITDFFELLKDQFREQHFIPISPRRVINVYTHFGLDSDGMIPMLQNIYRERGWPNLERYRKQECLEAVQMALEQRYPDHADFR
ncbi:hypothetical protein ONS95_011944 [Cadophora gregata]|uniref:uncharacterized protein n=1 Tax=Cadophora gregata TaxID=51156 RepID=UPI0026DD110C|nr:uncharacterized protein ONS95_011944 [Cadophora gregata]KAK0117609.1 hypothetical protein ONS95_011944 [Cadophora gregata]KAK0122660.1 hypothetical protein ONS96_009698 [Cadophora gregata f. sp. sojae]